ncbi:SDR family oxidoreductase, partial [bacterium]|nr:SDR family oxidoreductase [bacterium]
DDLKDKIPMDRMGTVEEMAKTAAFLVSDAASYVTGTTIYADGGMSAYPSFAEGG